MENRNFEQARELHQLGRLQEAFNEYQQILTLNPDHEGATFGQGLIFLQSNRFSEAIQMFEHANKLNPNNSEYIMTLGIAYSNLNDLERAELYFSKAIEISPNNLEARKNLGILFLNTSRPERAIPEFLKINKKIKNNPSTFLLLGIAYSLNSKHKEAIKYLRRSIQLSPNDLEAKMELANAYQAASLFDKSESEYLDIKALDENNLQLLYNLAKLKAKMGNVDEAIQLYRNVIALDENNIGALNNLGNLIYLEDDIEEAFMCLNKAITLSDNKSRFLYNLARKQAEFGYWDEAEENFKKIFHLDPTFGWAISNYADLLRNTARIEEAITFYQKLENLDENDLDAPLLYSNYIANLNYINEDNEEIYKKSKNWESRINLVEPPNKTVFKNDKTPNRPLKIGYVSADFKQHSNSWFFLPLLENHDKKNVISYCFSDTNHPDDITERIKQHCNHWHSITGYDNLNAYELIKNEKIDILVDLAGHLAGNRLTLFNYKPAPIQLTWLGYPNTTGLSTIDYRITDVLTDPKGEADLYYSEKLYRLPNGFLCYNPLSTAPEVCDAPCLTSSRITFGSFNNIAKVTKSTIELWAKCILNVPKSKLILKAKSLSNPSTAERIIKSFNEYGVDRERVELIPTSKSIEEHLSIYNQIDIALDTTPYNGTTTTFEALWMGVPVIALWGNRHASRVGGSILTNISHSNLVVDSKEDYIKVAKELAENPNRINKIRHHLRKKLSSSSYCDPAAFSKKMEAAYCEMWNQWSKSQ